MAPRQVSEPVMHMLAAVEQTEELEKGAGNIIFMCLFILAVIAVGIWWLRR